MSPAHLDEARRLYEEIRKCRAAWLPWNDLPGMVRGAWATAFFLSSLVASKPAPENKKQAEHIRFGPKPAPERYKAGTEPDPAGVLAASLGVPAT